MECKKKKKGQANNEHSIACWVTNGELNPQSNEEREKERRNDQKKGKEKVKGMKNINRESERERNPTQFACISCPLRAWKLSQVDLNRISIDLCLVYSMHVKSVFTPWHYPDILPAETV